MSLPDFPINHPKFLKAYAAAAEGRIDDDPAGSIGSTVVAYMGSDHFQTRAKSTREVWRRYLNDIRRRYGPGKIRDLETRHIRQALAPLSAHEANNRLKAWRALCRFALDSGRIDRNPALGVSKRPTPRSDGHEPWTREDVATFRRHWPIGTTQRLCFEVLHHTAAAVVDGLKLGDHNVKDGWIIFERQKSTQPSVCPFQGGPTWFEPSDMLHQCLDARESRHLVWITTKAGRPRSPKSVSQWFSAAARQAGVSKTAHGIRKHRANVFRENGATVDQRMAVLGHETTAQEAHYSKAADKQKIISGTDFSNSFSNSRKNVN